MKYDTALNIGAAAMVLALLAGCGQPGPLYMPKIPPKPAPASSAPAASTPTPPPASK